MFLEAKKKQQKKTTHTNGIYNTAKKAQHEQLKITFPSLPFPYSMPECYMIVKLMK